MAIPRSPYDQLHGLVYFPRLCDKIRLHSQGLLDADYQANLGHGMDLWTCQFLGLNYDELREQILAGASDEQAFIWSQTNGISRADHEWDWWSSFMRNRGYNDDLSAKLQQRKIEAGLGHRDDIRTFFDFIDVEEGRK